MTATPPEANTEYSRAPRASRGRLAALQGIAPSPQMLVAVVGVIGAVLLLVAEFSTLYVVHLTTDTQPVQSVSAGSHNAYAFVPIALLGAGLAIAAGRLRSRAAAGGLLALGVVALLIALIGDLPDTRAHGIAHQIVLASTSAGEAIYLETLGAIALLFAGGVGLLAATPSRSRGAPGERVRSAARSQS
jgi:hypothetical protein